MTKAAAPTSENTASSGLMRSSWGVGVAVLSAYDPNRVDQSVMALSSDDRRAILRLSDGLSWTPSVWQQFRRRSPRIRESTGVGVVLLVCAVVGRRKRCRSRRGATR